MAKISFRKNPATSTSPHIMTIKEKRYVTDFKRYKSLTLLFASISIIELIFIIARFK